jgi:hypothetical protein
LRNRIERFFNRTKNSRRVATRYDKLIESFAAFVLLACIRIWFKVCPHNLPYDFTHILSSARWPSPGAERTVTALRWRLRRS